MESAHRGLNAWKHSIDLAVSVTQVTARFPHDERYGLSAQLRRAAVSVPANISEGSGHPSRAARRNYIYIARASLNEVETLLVIAERVGYLSFEEAQALHSRVGDVARLLGGLVRWLKQVETKAHPGTPTRHKTQALTPKP
jgi:four helix bundle protein